MGGFVARAVVLALGCLVVACSSSPPTRFYTLSATAPEGSPPSGVGLVRIAGVTIPGELDRPQLVRRVGATQLNISELDRWAAPLDQTIQRVLSDDIARRVPEPQPGQRYAVTVEVQEFYGDADCNVTLRAAWTVKQTYPKAAHVAASAGQGAVPAGQGVAPAQDVQAAPPAPPNNEEIKVPSSGACPATLPAGMSTALGQLSDRIIAGVGHTPGV